MPHAEFEDVLRLTPNRPYRKLIEERLRGLSEAEAPGLEAEAEAGLPAVSKEDVAAFRLALDHTFLRSKLFWEVSTCREAIANILEVAAATIRDDAVAQAARRPLVSGAALASAVFEVATSHFVKAAYDNRRQRRFMAIRRGWLR